MIHHRKLILAILVAAVGLISAALELIEASHHHGSVVFAMVIAAAGSLTTFAAMVLYVCAYLWELAAEHARAARRVRNWSRLHPPRRTTRAAARHRGARAVRTGEEHTMEMAAVAATPPSQRPARAAVDDLLLGWPGMMGAPRRTTRTTTVAGRW